MIPYIHIPAIHIGSRITLYPFGILVGIGILIGYIMTHRRAKQLGIPTRDLDRMFFWTLLSSFLCAHVFNTLFYSTLPWGQARILELINPIRGGLSSVGGFIGAALGGLLWCFINKKAILPFADACGYGITFGWFFGRMGCAVAHDHPGREAAAHFPLAVAYPCPAAHCPAPDTWLGPTSSAFPRYDLGLYEAMLFGVLALLFLALYRRKFRAGVFIGSLMAFYGPVRWALDFLRAPADVGGDNRYGGWTPAQFVSLALFATGVCILLFIRKKSQTHTPDAPTASLGTGPTLALAAGPPDEVAGHPAHTPS